MDIGNASGGTTGMGAEEGSNDAIVGLVKDIIGATDLGVARKKGIGATGVGRAEGGSTAGVSAAEANDNTVVGSTEDVVSTAGMGVAEGGDGGDSMGGMDYVGGWVF